MNFPLNEKGGWVVPAGTKLEACEVPAYSQFGSCCKFASDCKFGIYCEFAAYCTFGIYCKFASHCKFASRCEFASLCEFASYCEFASGCTVEGVTLKRFLTLANVDGSGRQILIVQHDDGILIRAGCFLGTIEQFCEKAAAEGKHVYVAVVSAVCQALANLPEAPQPQPEPQNTSS